MGCLGGGVWHGFKGMRNAPRGDRLRGGYQQIVLRAPALGGESKRHKERGRDNHNEAAGGGTERLQLRQRANRRKGLPIFSVSHPYHRRPFVFFALPFFVPSLR